MPKEAILRRMRSARFESGPWPTLLAREVYGVMCMRFEEAKREIYESLRARAEGVDTNDAEALGNGGLCEGKSFSSPSDGDIEDTMSGTNWYKLLIQQHQIYTVSYQDSADKALGSE